MPPRRGATAAAPGCGVLANAVRHGFYSDVLSEEEQKLYEPAMMATLGDEVALSRIKLNRMLAWMQENPDEVTDGHRDRIDRMTGRIGDLEVKRSIIDRNNRADGDETDESEVIAAIRELGAHRMVHKPKANGNGKAKNGSHR